jgi:hypothetical protein
MSATTKKKNKKNTKKRSREDAEYETLCETLMTRHSQDWMRLASSVDRSIDNMKAMSENMARMAKIVDTLTDAVIKLAENSI